MLGIIPAAGAGSRIQPLAFSKELLPVGGRLDGAIERPRAVSEYLVDRMRIAGATKICFIIGAGKSDILEYYSHIEGVSVIFVVQPSPAGLCDAIFCAAPIVSFNESVAIGLPDTIWFPENGLAALPEGELSFLLFPVEHPEFFDVVVTDEDDRVREIQVKQNDWRSRWIWGAFKMPGKVFHELHQLWLARGKRDEYFGTLVNAWLANGGRARGIRAGESYVDVGTLDGYRSAIRLLSERRGMERPAEVVA
jgi:glucose-1-phosphate thymidylyltransferase